MQLAVMAVRVFSYAQQKQKRMTRFLRGQVYHVLLKPMTATVAAIPLVVVVLMGTTIHCAVQRGVMKRFFLATVVALTAIRSSAPRAKAVPAPKLAVAATGEIVKAKIPAAEASALAAASPTAVPIVAPLAVFNRFFEE
jgi:hypothetical protein